MSDFYAEQSNQEKYVKSIVPGVAYVESGKTVHYNEIPKWRTISIRYNVPVADETYTLANFDANEENPVTFSNWREYIKSISINGNVVEPIGYRNFISYHFSATGIYDIEFKMVGDTVPYYFLNGYRSYPEQAGETEIHLSSGFTKLLGANIDSFDFLTAVTIPEGITAIASGASFCNNYSLTSITFPSTLQIISSNNGDFLCNNINLSEITCLSSTAPTLPDDFYDFRHLATVGTLYYPAGSDYSTWLEKLPSGWTGVEI